MKVLLLQNIPKVGKRGDIKEVSDGFARNFLLKDKKAVEATARTITQVRVKEERDNLAKAKVKEEFESLQKSLPKEILLEVHTNTMGHLYAALHAGELSEEIQKKTGISIPVGIIKLKKPIKEVGTHAVSIISNENQGVITVVLRSSNVEKRK